MYLELLYYYKRNLIRIIEPKSNKYCTKYVDLTKEELEELYNEIKDYFFKLDEEKAHQEKEIAFSEQSEENDSKPVEP